MFCLSGSKVNVCPKGRVKRKMQLFCQMQIFIRTDYKYLVLHAEGKLLAFSYLFAFAKNMKTEMQKICFSEKIVHKFAL